MSAEEAIEKVANLDEVRKGMDIEVDEVKGPLSSTQAPPDKALFDSFMRKQDVEAQQAELQGQALEKKRASKANKANTDRNTLIDEVEKGNRKVSTRTYLAQAQDVKADQLRKKARDSIKSIRGMKRKLSNPDQRVRGSATNLLRNKLRDINNNLDIVTDKVGGTLKTGSAALEEFGDVPKPLKRFVNMLNSGQEKFEHLDQRLIEIGEGGDIAPAEMLAIQIKVGHIQHELELFSNLLNKAIDSTKQIMQVQV